MNTYAKMTLLAALVATSTLPTGALAAQQDASESYSLGEIVVSGEREGVEASETVRSVGSEEIKTRDARTLDQAISLLPGVNVRVGGEGIPRIDLRGFRTRHVLLLLDGIPMNSAFDQQFDPALIPTENIAEIKLTTGPSSVLYGQGGLGGVINVITKKGVKGIHGSVSAEAGDHQPYLLRGTLSGAAKGLDYFLGASAGKVDAFPLSDDFRATPEQDGGYRRNSDRERRNVLGTLGYAPSSDLALGLTVSYHEGSFGKVSSVINDPLDVFANAPKYVRVDDQSGFLVQLAADYAPTDTLTLRGWAFTNRSDQHETQYDDATFTSFNRVAGSFRQHIETVLQGVTVQPKYDLGKLGAVTLALSAEEDRWKNSGPLTTGLDTFSTLATDKTLGLYSAGVEYEVAPLPGLGLVAGYGHYWQTRDERDEDDYSLLAGASYDVLHGTRLKASFKRNVRFPSLGDLYDPDKGNTALVAERSNTYEAGVEQTLPLETTLGVTAFRTVARNLIQNDQSAGRSENLAEVRFYGAELALASKPLKSLLLRASYAYLHSEDRSREGRDQQQYTPQDKVTLEARYDFDCGFTPYASFLYVGNQYFYTKNNFNPVLKLKLKDYAVVNLKLSQRVLQNRVTLYVGADNLLDQNYETSYGFPQPGRFIYGGVEFRL